MSASLSDAANCVPRLAVRGMSKTFGAKRVVSDVSLTVRPGEIRGIVGQNGSGKSTVAKVLSGVYHPDRGCSVAVDGRPLAVPVHPAALRRAGVAVVHQDLGLVEEFSVLRNIRIGAARGSRITRRIDWRREAGEARRILDDLGEPTISLTQMVRELTPAKKAKVAIARGLEGVPPGQGLLVFDESTKSLPPADLEEFYEVVRELAHSGTGIVIISHRLSEVLMLADTVTILRDGETVGDGLATSGLDEATIARKMVGREVQRHSKGQAAESGRVVAELHSVTFPGMAAPLSLQLREGEIVGLTGLAGTAFEHLPDALAGERDGVTGSAVLSDGRAVDLGRATVQERLRRGLVVVPEERIKKGLALSLSVVDNMAVPWLDVRGRPWAVDHRWRTKYAADAIRKFDIRPPDIRAVVAHLSGGNQQKVMLAKWLAGAPSLLVLHEPTQAVDVQARSDILDAIKGAAAAGTAVLIVSTEVSDLSLVCHRVLVLHSDAALSDISGEISTDRILAMVYGGTRSNEGSSQLAVGDNSPGVGS